MGFNGILPSGNLLHSELERSTMLLMGKSTISMAIFNSYVKLPEGMVYGTQITIVNEVYKPTNITGGPHIVGKYHPSVVVNSLSILSWLTLNL